MRVGDEDTGGTMKPPVTKEARLLHMTHDVTDVDIPASTSSSGVLESPPSSQGHMGSRGLHGRSAVAHVPCVAEWTPIRP